MASAGRRRVLLVRVMVVLVAGLTACGIPEEAVVPAQEVAPRYRQDVVTEGEWAERTRAAVPAMHR